MAAVGEELVCERETDNSYDHCAVAVKTMRNIIGHLPRKLSKLCSLFLRRGGAIVCLVSGGKKKIIQDRHDSYNHHFLALWRTRHGTFNTRTNVSVIFGP